MSWKSNVLTAGFIVCALLLIPALFTIRNTVPLWVLAVLTVNLIFPYLVIGWLIDSVRNLTRGRSQPLRD